MPAGSASIIPVREIRNYAIHCDGNLRNSFMLVSKSQVSKLCSTTTWIVRARVPVWAGTLHKFPPSYPNRMHNRPTDSSVSCFKKDQWTYQLSTETQKDELHASSR